MTRLEYDLIVEQSPELNLPTWFQLHQRDRERLLKMDRTNLIANRAYQILRRDPGTFDYGIPPMIFHVREKPF